MERRKPERDEARVDRLIKLESSSDELVAALAAGSRYGSFGRERIWNVLTKIYGMEPFRLTSFEQFWNRELACALAAIVGPDYAEEMHEILKMRMEGQYASDMLRRSYHSNDFGYYAYAMIDLMGSLIHSSCYTQSVEELLYFNNDDGCYGYEYRLALRIRRGDEKIVRLVREAVLGDEPELLLSRRIIKAIIISGAGELLEDLMKLLLAAKLQEGLRQQILENADVGSTKVLARIIKLCLDEDLFRYSSTIRAFDVWTGMGYGNVKPASIKKYARYAYDCLTDEALRREYLNSENTQQAYFALWAVGCFEMSDTDGLIQKLLEDENRYRRVLGWLFVSRSNSSSYKMHYASRYLHERDEELLAWVLCCLPVSYRYINSYHRVGDVWDSKAEKNELFPADRDERQKLFAQLKEAALFVGNKHRSFSANPFDFIEITLENERLINCMLSLAGYDMDPELTAQLLDLQRLMNADQRRALIIHFVRPEIRPEHREFLRGCLNDRSVNVRQLAVERLSACKLDSEDYAALTEGLRSNSSALRKAIISVLRSRQFSELRPMLGGMLLSAEEYQNQAAIELLLELGDEQPGLAGDYSRELEELGGRKLSTQTRILLDKLCSKEEHTPEYKQENGYGLYDPAVISQFLSGIAPASVQPQKAGLLNKIFSKEETKNELLTAGQIRAMLPVWDELDAVLGRMNRVFEEHADYEYDTMAWGGRHSVLFGDVSRRTILLPAECGLSSLNDRKARIEMAPFYAELLKAMGPYALKAEKYLVLRYITTDSYVGHIPGGSEIAPWFIPYEQLQIAYSFHNVASQKYKDRYYQMISFIAKAHQCIDAHELFRLSLRLYRSMVAILGEGNLSRAYTRPSDGSECAPYYFSLERPVINHRMLARLRDLINDMELSDEDFKEWFLQEYRLEKLGGVGIARGLGMEDYFRACQALIAPRDALMEYLILNHSNIPRNIRILTETGRDSARRDFLEKYPWAEDVGREITERIVQMEEKRGELPTGLTHIADAIGRIEGAVHFSNLLAALGKESFYRGYEYSGGTTKKAVLSRLLKRCYPAEDDTPERLAALLKHTDISDERLAEAVMYAPQWAGIAEKILGWRGLKCGVWFFHAHVNEHFSAEKETEVAIFSPISPQQFNDGAFDKNWFFSAYALLGEARFRILYKSAKYISAVGNNHRRSQLYTDAVLGRLDIKKLEKEIEQKRNQERLRCYPLIPIEQGDRQEALRRYEFIQKFLKESKQFGAQRRENEKKACQTAMENLAITTGLMDVNRLMWQMESAKIAELAPYMQPVQREGASLRLYVDESGDAAVIVEKDGKVLKSPPKSLAKDEYFLELKALAKDLKEQKRRARESLERAMTESTLFGVEEILNIGGNPVLAPMMKSLVWTDGKDLGFMGLEEGSLALAMLSGETKPVCDGQLRIAHPHDLKAAGEWAGYMRLLYERKLKQPFKQVFREYYPITDDERREGLFSTRYTGHQVQPKKTIALLRGRGWTVDYEEGLQKVCYRENLIVHMYAMADWFSPSDIEAPTLEGICFSDRDSGESVTLEKVPPVLFSEVMRDIDLAVSVAHVGGVDPEASHSTVEMRVAIAAELAKLLRLDNVSWLGSHAKIHGKLANYSVHMGSGVVHAEGKGMIAILPVHSQARGRIFLPFADDDPKTSEIMSKIILLAEDHKIKDPAILDQL